MQYAISVYSHFSNNTTRWRREKRRQRSSHIRSQFGHNSGLISRNTNSRSGRTKLKSEVIKHIQHIIPTSRERYARLGVYIRMQCVSLDSPSFIFQDKQTKVKQTKETYWIKMVRKQKVIHKILPKKIFHWVEADNSMKININVTSKSCGYDARFAKLFLAS